MSLDEPDIVELSELHIQSVTEQGLYFEFAKKAWNILRKKLSRDQLGENIGDLT